LASISGTTFSGVSFSSTPGGILSGTLSSFTQSNVFGPRNYVLSVSDDSVFDFVSYSATASINFIYPTMYGFTTSVVHSVPVNTAVCAYINRTVFPSPGSQSIFLNYNGSGYLYYISPAIYSQPRYIKDPNGFIIHDYSNPGSSAFTELSYNASITPTGVGTPYTILTRVWRTINSVSYPGGNFEFIF
jgi:hypothetical protein